MRRRLCLVFVPFELLGIGAGPKVGTDYMYSVPIKAKLARAMVTFVGRHHSEGRATRLESH